MFCEKVAYTNTIVFKNPLNALPKIGQDFNLLKTVTILSVKDKPLAILNQLQPINHFAVILFQYFVILKAGPKYNTCFL